MFAIALALIILALALGAFSSLIFAWQWLLAAPDQLSASVALIVILGVGLTLFVYLIRRTAPPSVRAGRGWILLMPAVIYAGYWMVQHVRDLPHGGYDAWALWNVHARFLYRGGAGAWRNVFAQGHWDYPFLLPGLVDGGWTIAGADHSVIPALLAAAFAILAIGLISSSVSALSADDRGCLAGVILLATPSFLMNAGYQMADLPLALYILTTVVLLKFAEVWPQVRTTLLALAGFSAGLAAWTKNEGLLFLIVICVVQFTSVAFQHPKRTFREIGIFCVGLAPMLMLIAAFKILLAHESDMLSDPAFLSRAMVPGRYAQIARAFFQDARGFGDAYDGGVHPFLMLAIYLALYPPLTGTIKISSLRFLLVPLLMLGGYFMVYVMTPYDLKWHLDTSLDRLFMQIWPVSIFVVTAPT